MMGRGSVLISQAPLKLPKALQKELSKQLDENNNNGIQTRQYAPSRRTGLFSYGAFGLGDQLPLGNIAEEMEELSDDEKEFFMPTLPKKVKSIESVAIEK